MREIIKPSFKDRTTIRLGGVAIAELLIEEEEDLALLSDRIRRHGGRPFILGYGSNLLARDGELPLTLIRLAAGGNVKICGKKNGKVLLGAPAGMPLKKLLAYCLKNGLSGLEGLVGIPGSCGGAAMMNAGSFGSCTADSLHSLKCWVNNSIQILKIKDLKPSYRNMEFPFPKDDCLILEVFFALTPLPINVIFNRMSLNFFEKKSRQPVTAWSGGCAFKNPPNGDSAGKLLEKAGFRGKELGGMRFSPKHANFLVNTGRGTSSAALELLQMATEEVARQFGILLEPELKIIS